MNCPGSYRSMLSVALSLCALGAQVPSALAQQQSPGETELNPAAISMSAGSATPPVVDYYIVNQPLPELLEMFARDLGLRVDVSPAVRGSVRKRKYSGSIVTVLNKVAQSQSLDWFHFNGVYYFSARSEATTRLARLETLGADDAISILTESGLVLERYPINQVAGQSTLALSGPPKLLAIAEAIVEAAPEKASEIPPATPTITVRRGIESNLEEIN